MKTKQETELKYTILTGFTIKISLN